MSEEYSNGYARGYEAGQQSVLKLAEQPALKDECAMPEVCPEHAHAFFAKQPAQPQQDDAWKAEQKTLADEAVKCATEALANPNHPATMAAREYYGAAQRKPLTFSKLCDIEYEITHRDGDFSILKFARAIEAAHGIKENT